MENAQWSFDVDLELKDAFEEFSKQQVRFRGINDKEASSPLPQWLKSSDFTMMTINPAYERTFCIAAGRYVGSKDQDVWPDDVAARFKKHDQAVLDSGESLHCVETVPNPDGGQDWPLYVIKYPVKGDNFTGVGGACVPLEWILKAARRDIGREELCKLIG